LEIIDVLAVAMAKMICDPLIRTCGEGKGECWNNGTYCHCDDVNYRDKGDFQRSTGCSVYVPTYKGMWAFCLFIYFIDLVLSLIASVYMKRRTKEVENQERKHALFCSCNCIFVIALAGMHLSSEDAAIAVDMPVSIMFSITQLSSWVAVIVKPSTKSETSIARFAMEQTGWIMSTYFALLPLFVLTMFGASITVIVGAVHPETQNNIIVAFFVCFWFQWNVVKNLS
jgi:hypothetical protein